MFDKQFILNKLIERQQQGLLRQLESTEFLDQCRVIRNGQKLINFVSNHYLDLAHHPEIIRATQEATALYGTGSTGSRLLGGDLSVFHITEQFLAKWKNMPCARLYATGYMANVGLISAVADAQTHIFCDRLIHASVIDGVRLSNAKLHRFIHNDPNDLERLLKEHTGYGWIVVESLYSMDGDLAPLADYAQLARQYQVGLIVDEAHAEGVFGPDGKGLVHALGLENQVDAVVATFGKAYGVAGACVLGSQELCDWLTNTSRSFIYSTAMAPAVAASIQVAVQVAVKESWRRERLQQNSHQTRLRLKSLGLNILQSESQIIPVVLGSNERVLEASAALQASGLWVAPIREPTVPKGTARLRINLSAGHEQGDIDQLVNALERYS